MDQRKIYELSQGLSDTTEGVVVSIDWAERLVEVNQNGVTIRMPWSGPAPWVGDRVRILKLGLKPFCTLIEGSPLGTVQTTGSPTVTVLGDDGVTYRYPHVGVEPVSGAVVALDHGRHVIVGTLSTSPVEPDEQDLPAPPPAAPSSAWFSPAWSGNWRLGVDKGGLVESSYNRTAAYGYGTSIADTIPDSATIRRAEWHLVLNWDELPQNNATAGTHELNQRPASMVEGDLSGAIVVPTGSRAIDIRGAVADLLKTGAIRGLGFYSDSTWWRQYGEAPGSGRIFIEWSG